MGLGWLATVLMALAALVSPASVAGAPSLPDDPTERREGNNPSIAQKFLGYDASTRANGRRPDVLILGSSRAVQLDPQQVRQLTGRTAYNAGISSGAARELLATASFADLRGAGDPPHLVVMLDLEAFDNRRPTARVLDYERRLDQARAACDELPRCRTSWFAAARRIVADAIARQRGSARNYRQTQRPDGRQINGLLERLDAQGVDLTRIRDDRIATRIRSYRPGGFDKVYPVPTIAFERMLQLANDRGDVPFVVITTMHPDCIRRCGAAGWTDRRREVRAMLDELATRREFRLADLSHPASWGGSAADFYDEIHLRPLGAARVVRRLAALGAFEPHSAAGNTSMS